MLTKKDLSLIKDAVVVPLNNRIDKLDRKVDKVHRNTIKIINFLDRDLMNTAKRVDKIESHLGIGSTL